MKSLDKIAIFLGFPNLNAFLNKDQINKEQILWKEFNDSKENTDLFEFFKELIRNSCQDEFEQLKKLPEIDLRDYPKYAFVDSPLGKRLVENLYLNSKLNYRINANSDKSNYELYDFKIIKIEEDNAVISVKEFWNLDWVDKETRLVTIFNNLSRQTYFLKKRDGVWKIWDNYNPNYTSFINHLNEKI